MHLDLFQRLIVSPVSVSAILLGDRIPRVLRVNDTGSLDDLVPRGAGTAAARGPARGNRHGARIGAWPSNSTPSTASPPAPSASPASGRSSCRARRATDLVTLLVEKQQVQLLAASVVKILAQIETEPSEEEPEHVPMDLEPPLEPEWRAGRLAIGYEEDRDLLVLEVEEFVPRPRTRTTRTSRGDTAVGGDDEPEPGLVRFWATRDQMLALARHGA